MDSPKLQQTTRLMDDRTLRAGDAVMTKDGLRIFTGEEADHRKASDFIPLRAAKHDKRRLRLAAMPHVWTSAVIEARIWRPAAQ